MLPQLEERRIEVLARNRGIKKAQASDSIGKLMGAYIRKAEEGELGRISSRDRHSPLSPDAIGDGKALKDAAQHYKVDTDAITQKVKAEFAAKEKAKPQEEGRRSRSRSCEEIHRSIGSAKLLQGACPATGSFFFERPSTRPLVRLLPAAGAALPARPTGRDDILQSYISVIPYSLPVILSAQLNRELSPRYLGIIFPRFRTIDL